MFARCLHHRVNGVSLSDLGYPSSLFFLELGQHHAADLAVGEREALKIGRRCGTAFTRPRSAASSSRVDHVTDAVTQRVESRLATGGGWRRGRGDERGRIVLDC